MVRSMKKIVIGAVCCIALAVAGFAAYRVGLLDRFTGAAQPAGTAAAGGTPTAENPVGATAASGTAGGAPVEAGAASAPSAEPGTTLADMAAPQPAADTPAPAPGGPAPTPVPAGLVAVAKEGEAVSNKAIEIRVTDVRRAAAAGNRQAPEGREFVTVFSDWKSLVPPQKVNRKKAQDRSAGMGSLGFGGGVTAKDRAADEADATLEDVPFEIGPLTQKVWLVANGTSAEGIDVAATNAAEGPLPTGTLRLPALNSVKSGPLVFLAPANAQALALLVLDSANGHLLVPIRGAAPVPASTLGGASKSNELVDLAIAGASWSTTAPATPGSKTLVVTVRGISRQNAIADIPFGDFSFLQTGAGCIAQPERPDQTLARPFSPKGSFIPFIPTEGQLAFVVPVDTQSAALLLRLNQGASLDLPVLGDGSARKPPVATTHDDGKVLRIGIVGASAPPATVSAPRAGLEYVAVDYIVENLTVNTGIDLQPAPQLALADAEGKTYPPDQASQLLPCRLAGRNTVPAAGWRRFSLLYAVPVGQPLSLKYRGFESEGTLKVR
jgi:hypothetical protein